VATLTDVIDAPAMRWIPLMVQLRLLETIERLFGNGSYDFVRRIARRSVPHYGSIRRYLLRALPLHVVIDLAPAAYLRELNHGRMEVEMVRNVAHFKHYDWLSSPARCNAWLGTYQGAFDVRRKAAEIRKAECLLRGDEFCGYVATWEG